MPDTTAAPLSLPRPLDSDPVAMGADAIRDLADRLAACLQAEAWTAPTFTGTWVNYNTATHVAAGYRRIGDRIELRGFIMSGTSGTSAFTLPSGFRPARIHHYPTIANAGIGYVEVRADGTVVPTAGSTAWLSLSGISFSVL